MNLTIEKFRELRNKSNYSYPKLMNYNISWKEQVKNSFKILNVYSEENLSEIWLQIKIIGLIRKMRLKKMISDFLTEENL